MKNKLNFGFRCLAVFCVAIIPVTAWSDGDKWRDETITDALQAAPPSVTGDASIFGWTSDGKLTLARYGSGPYTCIASGSFSLRLGKPPLPYPDPMCLDQNAWSFLQALWAGNSQDALPAAPGLIWMLAGMNVTKSAVDIGASTIKMTKETEAAGAKGVIQMTPHVMIMPLPFDKNSAQLTTSYSLDDPLNAWIMAAGKPHEHLMVHFSSEDAMALMKAGK